MMDITFKKAFDFLEEDENILSYARCSLEVATDSICLIDGFFIVTNRRMFFYSKDRKNNIFESYKYETASEIKKENEMDSKVITLKYKNNSVKLKHIFTSNLDRLITIVNNKIVSRKPIFCQ